MRTRIFSGAILALTLVLAPVLATPSFADPAQELLVAIANNDPAAAAHALAGGAHVDDNVNLGEPFGPQPALPASILLAAPKVRDLLIADGAHIGTGTNAALEFAMFTSDADSVRALLQASSGAIPTDQNYLDLLARRPPADIMKQFSQIMRNKILAPSQPEPPAPSWKVLLAPQFAKAQDDPAVAIAQLLVDHGADINAADSNGRKPLDLFAANGDVVIALYLSSKGATLTTGRSLPAELLPAAASAGNSDGITTLLGMNADVSAPDHDGNCALPAALGQGQIAISQALLSNGADPNAAGPKQDGPLALAASFEDKTMLDLLLARGAKPNLVDPKGDWAVREAVSKGWPDGLRDLIAHGADPNLTDPQGNTALHAFLTGSDGTDRKSTPADVADIQSLANAHFNFGAVNTQGQNVIASLLVAPIDYDLLKAITAAGGRPAADDLALAISRDDTALLSWLLQNGGSPDGTAAGRSLLDLSRSKDPALEAILVKSGASLPTDKPSRDSLLLSAVQVESSDLVAALLGRGIDANASYDHKTAAELALDLGDSPILQSLLDAHADMYALDDSGNSMLARLLTSEVISMNINYHPIMQDQEAAIAVLVSNDFDLDKKNNNGQTPLQIASEKPDTLNRFRDALAQAQVGGSELHKAVRANDYDTVVQLITGGADINQLDSLQRSPLTLALNLQRYSIAELLLRKGAQVTYLPRTSYQKADIEFASDQRLAAVFQTLLLRNQLLQLSPNDAVNHPDTSIGKLTDNLAYKVPDTAWTMTCTPCTGSRTFKGNVDGGLIPIRSERDDANGTTSFGLVQYAIGPVTATWPNGQKFFVLTFDVSGAMTVAKCAFDFLTNPTCYPRVTISNPDEGTGLQIRTDDGFAPLPLLPLTVVQAGTSTAIAPGASVIFDRSAGDLQITAGPVQSKVFGLHYTISMGDGPPTDVSDDFSLPARMATYARIASLKAQFDNLPNGAGGDQTVEAKTLATAIYVLSAEAVKHQYLQNIRQLLVERRDAIANADARVRDLRDAIIASDTMTPAQIDLTIARVDSLLPQLSGDQKQALQHIRDELVAAKTAVAGTNQAIHIVRDDYYTWLDGVIAEYQGLMLELAQYVTPDELLSSGLVSGAQAAAIKQVLRPSDVLIGDGAVSNHGAAIRAAFGIPNQGP
jgi:ankyrin repeat protein